MDEYWTVLLSVVFGALGYLITTFWVAPLIRYREAKHQIYSDLVFFANALGYQPRTEPHVQRVLDRLDSNRRTASELLATANELPRLYKLLLRCRKEDPSRAASELLGLSNSVDEEVNLARIRRIEECLHLPPSI